MLLCKVELELEPRRSGSQAQVYSYVKLICGHSDWRDTKARGEKTSHGSQIVAEPLILIIRCYFYYDHNLKRWRGKNFIEIALQI